MTATFERIKNDIKTLDLAEIELLYFDLQENYVFATSNDEASVIENEWDKELTERVKDVEEGRVGLVSGEDFNRHVDQLYAKHGLTRTQAS